MATLQASTLLFSSTSVSRKAIKANLCTQNSQRDHLSAPYNPTNSFIDELKTHNSFQTMTKKTSTHKRKSTNNPRKEGKPSTEVVEELYTIMELVSDRVEMHKNVAVQRDNWNRLLLISVNGMTLSAATMAGLAASCGGGTSSLLALKLSSSLLYMAATGVLMVMSKIQPSQLAEEQRNASRLFKQLHEQIKNKIALRMPSRDDVEEAVQKVLALDRAYPLPLLGAMLDKFPKTVEPAVWWPREVRTQEKNSGFSVRRGRRNGWSKKLEGEMREIVGVMKRKDSAEYLRLSKLVLKVNKTLAICGPFFTGLAAVGSAFVGTPWQLGSWGVVVGVLSGVLGAVVNTIEHGGQVGMVFEMYRSSAGFFMLMEESIESTLREREVEDRENGKVFEAEVALKLGRSLGELKQFASLTSSPSSPNPEVVEEFASKLF